MCWKDVEPLTEDVGRQLTIPEYNEEESRKFWENYKIIIKKWVDKINQQIKLKIINIYFEKQRKIKKRKLNSTRIRKCYQWFKNLREKEDLDRNEKTTRG